MARITFLNDNSEKDLTTRGKNSLESTIDDLTAFMNADDLEEVGNLGSFYDYGLSIDYVAPGTFEDEEEGYLRYQFSWGGPSDELRFYFSPGGNKPYLIEYVFMDWYCGVGFDVTKEECCRWAWDWLNDCGVVESEIERAIGGLKDEKFTNF